jgi:FMN phosphatase YigB (HAD superfamily)
MNGLNFPYPLLFLLFLLLMSTPALRCFSTAAAAAISSPLTKVRVLSLDITGTLLIHKEPIMNTYCNAFVWARFPNPPCVEELKPAFKAAFYEQSKLAPCYGYPSQSSREWWATLLASALEKSGRKADLGHYSPEDFQRAFRRIYQHYGSLAGYELLPDAISFLQWADKAGPGFYQGRIGLCTNTPLRSVETVVPMLGLHNHCSWAVCSQEIGAEKPSPLIYDKFFERASFWVPDLQVRRKRRRNR